MRSIAAILGSLIGVSMAVQFWNGQVLFANGKVAMHPDCCCVCYHCAKCCFSNHSTVGFTGLPLPDEDWDYCQALKSALQTLDHSNLPFRGSNGNSGYYWMGDWAEFSFYDDYYEEQIDCRTCYWVFYDCRDPDYWGGNSWHVGYDVEWKPPYSPNTWEWYGGENLNFVYEGYEDEGRMCCGVSRTVRFYNWDGCSEHADDVDASVTINHNKCCKDENGDCYPEAAEPPCNENGETNDCEEEGI